MHEEQVRTYLCGFAAGALVVVVDQDEHELSAQERTDFVASYGAAEEARLQAAGDLPPRCLLSGELRAL